MLRRSNTLLQIASHVASSAKHLRAEAKHHNTAVQTYSDTGVYGDVYGNVFQNVFPNGVFVDLNSSAREEFGNRLTAVQIGEKLVDFWKEYPTLSNQLRQAPA